MKAINTPRLIAAALATILFAGCAQDARMAGVERRQDNIDHRYEGRTERRQVRGEREDARVEARMDSW